MTLQNLLDAFKSLRALRASLAVGAHQAACDAALARIRELVEMIYPETAAVLTAHTPAERTALLELPAPAFKAYVAAVQSKPWDGMGS